MDPAQDVHAAAVPAKGKQLTSCPSQLPQNRSTPRDIFDKTQS